MEEKNTNVITQDCNSPVIIAKELGNMIMPAKANASFMKLLIMGIMAGAFIGFGAETALTVSSDASKYVGYGIAKLLSGFVFSTGLMMVILTGAELFTGNVLIAISVLQKKATLKSLLRNWLIVYFANFLGALILVWLIYLSSSWASTGGLVGAASLKVAYAKVNLSFVEAFSRGILCNWIVCLAVWMACASKHVIGKLFAIFFPITIFVASGYEHSVANMFFIPKGLLMKNSAEVIAASGLTPEQLSTLNLKTFLINNLVPVTLGNIIGVVIFVAFLFWVVYLRKNED